MNAAQKLAESNKSYACRFSGDVLDVMVKLENADITGHYVMCGNCVFFEDEDDSIIFKLSL